MTLRNEVLIVDGIGREQTEALIVAERLARTGIGIVVMTAVRQRESLPQDLFDGLVPSFFNQRFNVLDLEPALPQPVFAEAQRRPNTSTNNRNMRRKRESKRRIKARNMLRSH